MNNIKITTNNKPRQLIYGYELTDKQKQDFDYIDDIHSNGWGGIRIEMTEEEISSRGGRHLVRCMSTVLSEKDALRLRDSILEKFPIG